MNRRGFFASLGAGLITAAAVTRLATAKLELADDPAGEEDGFVQYPREHVNDSFERALIPSGVGGFLYVSLHTSEPPDFSARDLTVEWK